MATLKYKDSLGNWQPLITEVPTKVSQLDNDLNFIQGSVLPLSIANGGFGGTTAEQARTNLGIESRLKTLENAIDILMNNDGSDEATFVSSTTYILSGTARRFNVYRRGKLATYMLRFQKSGNSTGSEFVKIATIPEGYRPSASYYMNVPIQSSTVEVELRFDADGSVMMHAANTTSNWVNCTITLPIHSYQY